MDVERATLLSVCAAGGAQACAAGGAQESAAASSTVCAYAMHALSTQSSQS
jgi:hypothetical protein